MKKIIYILLLIGILISCSDDNKDGRNGPAHLSVSKNSVNFEAKSSDERIVVKTNDANWKVQIPTEADWCFASPVITGIDEEYDLVIFAKENLGKEVRTTTILITADGSETQKIEVVQLGSGAALILDKEEIHIPLEGASIELEITTNVEYEIIIPDADKNWIDLVYSSMQKDGTAIAGGIGLNIVTFQVKENPFEIERSSVIQIIEKDVKDGAKAEFTIIQEKKVKVLEADKESEVLDILGGEFSITIKTNVEYKLDETSLPTWISLKSKEKDVFTFTAEKFETENLFGRTAEILFVEEGDNEQIKEAKVSIEQDGIVDNNILTGVYRISGISPTEIYNPYASSTSIKKAYNQFEMSGYGFIGLKPIVTIADDLKVSLSVNGFVDEGSCFDLYTKTFIIIGKLNGKVVDQRWSLLPNGSLRSINGLKLTGQMDGAGTGMDVVNDQVREYIYSSKVNDKTCKVGLAINEDNTITVYSAGNAIKDVRENSSTYDPSTKTYNLKFIADLDATTVTEHNVTMTIKEP